MEGRKAGIAADLFFILAGTESRVLPLPRCGVCAILSRNFSRTWGSEKLPPHALIQRSEFQL
jgi:hypothetical protein